MSVLSIENPKHAQHAPQRRPRRQKAASLDVTFTSLGVSAPVVATLARAGITAPFPIQTATLPDALAGLDILGRGQTGSGKTLAFSIPLVDGLAGGHTSACRPRGLVLVPTRELASQVHAVLLPLAAAVGLSVATVFGGTSQRVQVAALRNRADIIVACPGRLADLIEQGHCHLGDVEITVVDVSALDRSRHTVIYLGAPGIGVRGMYAAIVTALGQRPRFHCASLIPQAQDLLVAETAERNKTPVIICDESHLLDADAIDGLRCLANIGMDATPLCMLLLGQPTLRRRLRLGPFAALDQRVGLRYAISGLADVAECASYVAHHLKISGRADTVFSGTRWRSSIKRHEGCPGRSTTWPCSHWSPPSPPGKGIVDEAAARATLAEVTAE